LRVATSKNIELLEILLSYSPTENIASKEEILMNLSPKKKADMDAKWQQVAAKAVTQEDFKKKLLKDTLGVMKEHGLEIPEKAKVSVTVDKEINIGPPENCDEALKEEITWWRWRIAAIKEFGQELKKRSEDSTPLSEEGI
jgi:hypothetical protein